MENSYTFLDEYKLAVQVVKRDDGITHVRIYKNELDDQGLLMQIDNGEVTYFYL